jgi:DNA end-binding protein Ku
MAARTSWEGYLRLNLLAVPVKAYTATVSGGGKISFNMLHEKCHSRIQYKKFCPVHGEVPNEEIVSGYEFAKGKYLIVDPDELDKLVPENDKAINIDVFIRPDALDPAYYSGRTYYLVPDGRVAEKPYAVLQRVMAEQDRYAIAKVVFSGKEQLVAVRPVDGLLAMCMLNFDQQIKKPSTFKDEIPDVAVADEELKLAESLINASTTDHFDFGRYEDEYTGKLTKLLDDKAAGKKIAPAKGPEEPVVINLMDALRKSLDRAKQEASAKNGNGEKEPEKKTKAKKEVAARKPRQAASRKTG